MRSPTLLPITVAALLAAAAAPSAAQVTLRGNLLEVDLRVPHGVGQVELQLESGRNRPVVRHTDRSPFAPPDWVDKPPNLPPDRQVWYPVVDLAADSQTEAVAEFAPVPPGCRWRFNSMFHSQSAPLTLQIVIPSNRLEPWENLLFVEGGPAELRRFYLRTRASAVEGRVRCRIALLSPVWYGTVRWRDPDDERGAVLGSQQLPPPPADDLRAWGPPTVRGHHLPPVPPEPPPRQELIEGLQDCVRFVLAARNTAPHSPTRDGFFLLYDLDARTYRTSHWMWSWGVIIRMLITASQVPEVAAAFDEDLLAVAARAGQRTLAFQHDRPDHEIDALVTARFNPGPQYEGGSQEFVATADALFLAGWGWVPLYEAIGDRRYLEAAERLCAAVDRLAQRYDVVPQDWLPATGRWTPSVLNEVGFGAEGFAELYRVNRQPATEQAGRRFIDALIDRLERPDGLWERSFSPTRPPPPFGVCHTRGQGWAMEGLLAAHRLAPQSGYLTRAQRLAGHLLARQQPSGCWSFIFDEDPAAAGIAEKGTAVWSLLLYRLHQANGDPAALAAARRALRFCLAQRYRGPDPHAAGGIVGCSPNSGIVYRHWWRIGCTYTSAFMGLALAAELQN